MPVSAILSYLDAPSWQQVKFGSVYGWAAVLCLIGILFHSHLLDLQLFDLVAQLAIFLPHTAQIKIIVPKIGGPALDAHQTFFKWRDG